MSPLTIEWESVSHPMYPMGIVCCCCCCYCCYCRCCYYGHAHTQPYLFFFPLSFFPVFFFFFFFFPSLFLFPHINTYIHTHIFTLFPTEHESISYHTIT
ncbi:hypothetical protein BKA57DRAFT_161025 [Linnemannia elongata]|nr:hypothetical protein BKA57DRAFT_161025 [Linnemannia elongata]